MLCAKPEVCQFVYCPYTFFVLVSSVAANPSFHISPVPFPFLIIFPGPWAAAQFQHSIL